jgi:hypothetical protein
MHNTTARDVKTKKSGFISTTYANFLIFTWIKYV